MSSKRLGGVIEGTLMEIHNSLERAIFAEETARREGLLQALDPRVKVVGLLMLLLAVGFSRKLTVILVLYLCTLVLATLSAVSPVFFIKRVWTTVLLFTGIIALPALFITPGSKWLQLSPGIGITYSGVLTTCFLLSRVGTSISLTALFILTTSWNDTLKALGVLHVPETVILVFGMTYRYIRLLLHILSDMLLSRKSRTLRKLSRAEEYRLLAAIAGSLVGKSLLLSSEVHLAMQSRGYRGYPRTMTEFRMRRLDWLAALIITGITAAAIWFGR